MLSTRQPIRTYEGLRQAGVAYHSLRQGGRLPAPEESLGVQRAPVEEGPFERPSDLRMDYEQSIRCRRIPFENQEITFAYLTHGGKWPAANLLSKKWAPHTARAIHRIADETLLRMVRHCAGRCGCR